RSTRRTGRRARPGRPVHRRRAARHVRGPAWPRPPGPTGPSTPGTGPDSGAHSRLHHAPAPQWHGSRADDDSPPGTCPGGPWSAVVVSVAGSALCDHAQREVRGDGLVQPHAHGVGANGLDRATDVNVALVDAGAAGLPDRTGDQGGGDGTEQLAVLAGPDRELDLQRLDLVADLAGMVEVTDLAGVPAALDALDLGLGALGPRHRVALRDQEVAAVAVLHLDDVAGQAELLDLGGQDELHVRCLSQRAVDAYGSSAISRAFLIAVATLRWSCTDSPVTRRARILPRSEMNLRSSATSL